MYIYIYIICIFSTRTNDPNCRSTTLSTNPFMLVCFALSFAPVYRFYAHATTWIRWLKGCVFTRVSAGGLNRRDDVLSPPWNGHPYPTRQLNVMFVLRVHIIETSSDRFSKLRLMINQLSGPTAIGEKTNPGIDVREYEKHEPLARRHCKLYSSPSYIGIKSSWKHQKYFFALHHQRALGEIYSLNLTEDAQKYSLEKRGFVHILRHTRVKRCQPK